MKKIIQIISFFFFSINAYSQTNTIILNADGTIKVDDNISKIDKTKRMILDTTSLKEWNDKHRTQNNE